MRVCVCYFSNVFVSTKLKFIYLTLTYVNWKHKLQQYRGRTREEKAFLIASTVNTMNYKNVCFTSKFLIITQFYVFLLNPLKIPFPLTRLSPQTIQPPFHLIAWVNEITNHEEFFRLRVITIYYNKNPSSSFRFSFFFFNFIL